MGCATSKATHRGHRTSGSLSNSETGIPSSTVPLRQSRPTEYNHPTPQVTPYSSDERPRVVIPSHQDDSAPPSPPQSAYATTITTTNSRPTTTAALDLLPPSQEHITFRVQLLLQRLLLARHLIILPPFHLLQIIIMLGLLHLRQRHLSYNEQVGSMRRIFVAKNWEVVPLPKSLLLPIVRRKMILP